MCTPDSKWHGTVGQCIHCHILLQNFPPSCWKLQSTGKGSLSLSPPLSLSLSLSSLCVIFEVHIHMFFATLNSVASILLTLANCFLVFLEWKPAKPRNCLLLFSRGCLLMKEIILRTSWKAAKKQNRRVKTHLCMRPASHKYIFRS